MENYDNLIKKEAVSETVALVMQRLKDQYVEYLEEKIRQGVSVGQYTLYSSDKGYEVHRGHRTLCSGLDSLEVAFAILQLKLRKPSRDISTFIKADHEYAKLKNDMTVYLHIIETSNSFSAVMVAEDRLNETIDKMEESKEILSKLKSEVNTAFFDK